MEVTIRTEGGLLRLDAEAMDTAVFLGRVFGYHMDLEPDGTNGYSLTASHRRSNHRISATGNSIVEAAEKLIELLTNGVKGE